MVVMQEPNEGETFQVGALKELSGGDTITVRTLHKEPFDFNPQFTIFCTCNQLPKVPADDGGTWRRIRVVKFNSKFVENPDPNCPNEFPIDYDLQKKLKEWAKPFFWLLTQHYQIFQEKGNPEPEEVLCATNEYQEMNDNFSDFLVENIDSSIPSASLELGELYSLFQLWFKKTISDKPPSRKELQQYLEKKWGPATINPKTGKKSWMGKRLKDEEEETHIIIEDNDNTAGVFC